MICMVYAYVTILGSNSRSYESSSRSYTFFCEMSCRNKYSFIDTIPLNLNFSAVLGASNYKPL